MKILKIITVLAIILLSIKSNLSLCMERDDMSGACFIQDVSVCVSVDLIRKRRKCVKRRCVSKKVKVVSDSSEDSDADTDESSSDDSVVEVMVMKSRSARRKSSRRKKVSGSRVRRAKAEGIISQATVAGPDDELFSELPRTDVVRDLAALGRMYSKHPKKGDDPSGLLMKLGYADSGFC